MKVIIVGAGLGGLSAALCFARRGYDVTVLERSPQLTNRGGGINIRPGASRIMHSWGLAEGLAAISDKTPSVLLRSAQTGDIATRFYAVDTSEFPDWGTARPVVIDLLYQQAIAAGAKVSFNAHVVDVGETAIQAVVSLDDGTTHTADMVLAADGIRSGIRPKILVDVDGPTEPIISPTTFYGVTLDAEQALSTPGTARLTDQINLNCWMGQDGFAITRYTPTLHAIGLLFAIRSETDQKGMWDENGDIDFVRSFFKDSCSELTTALRLAKSCDRWKLAELPPLPRWSSKGGRIVLLGDSAHAMHPNAAQGFSQIVEDIGVLEFLLARDPAPAANLPKLVGVWQTIRKPRVELIQRYAKWNTEVFQGSLSQPGITPRDQPRAEGSRGIVKNMRKIKPDMTAEFYSYEFLKWTIDFDAVGEARKHVERLMPRL